MKLFLIKFKKGPSFDIPADGYDNSQLSGFVSFFTTERKTMVYTVRPSLLDRLLRRKPAQQSSNYSEYKYHAHFSLSEIRMITEYEEEEA